jgi:hypothetical protein
MIVQEVGMGENWFRRPLEELRWVGWSIECLRRFTWMPFFLGVPEKSENKI